MQFAPNLEKAVDKVKTEKQLKGELSRKLEKYAELREEILALANALGVSQFRSNRATVSRTGERQTRSIKIDDVLNEAELWGARDAFEELIRYGYAKPGWRIVFTTKK